jgi:3',5'-cyclic AMP phosphodiesterase CpdA
MAELLAQLTDLHVQVGSEDQLASERVELAIELLGRLDRRPDAILLTGDLVNTGTAAEYDRLSQLLGPLFAMGIPLLPIVGNHDDRQLLRDTFEGAPNVVDLGAERHVQYATQVDGLRVLALDTQHTGHDDGELGEDRLRWLEAQLQTHPDTPTLVAMHHPPAPIGLPNLDSIAVRSDQAAALADILGRHRQVTRIVCGHVHRAVTTNLRDVPVFCCPSVFLPARPDLEPGPPITLVDGPVGIGLHVRAPGGAIASHARVIGPAPHTAPPRSRPVA